VHELGTPAAVPAACLGKQAALSGNNYRRAQVFKMVLGPRAGTWRAAASAIFPAIRALMLT
jgi:hypothetical protein